MNKVRSYANSYLYTRIPDYERNILEFVMGAERIDKSSEAFYGIIEDVKRRQTSAVLSRVLARDDVILCTYNKPLPASFKVFACKDVKTDQKVKVFIDLTGLMTLKNGFYTISKIDVFCSYLLSAMANIIYNENPTKLLNNSTVIQTSTECFVALSSHIFDYLRVNGYSENKNKISYIFAIYFQSTILGLDRTDASVKNLASKISTIPARDINAMEIYFNDEDLVNIDTLIKCVTNVFKMKGVGTDIFIEKWTWFYGVGTQFATELFPAFATMLSDAYCGAYVNNQKTIEKCCGRDMVTFTTTLLRIGGDTIDKGGYRYESTLDRDIDKTHLTVTQEGLIKRAMHKEFKLNQDDYKYGGKEFTKKIKNLLDNGYDTAKERSLAAREIAMKACGYAEIFCYSTYKYNNSISSAIDTVKSYLKPMEKKSVVKYLEKNYNKCIKMMNSGQVKNIGRTKQVIADIKKSVKMLDPSSIILKETVYEYNDDVKEIIEDCENLIGIIEDRENTFLTDEEYESVLVTEGAIADKISSLIDSFFNKIEKRKKEIKEKIAESKRQKVFDKMTFQNLDIIINNYVDIADVSEINKKCYKLYDDWVNESIKIYNEIVSSSDTEEAIIKSMEKKNYLANMRKRIKNLYDNIDVQKETYAMFGFDKKPKKVKVTKNLIDKINKNDKEIESLYNSMLNILDSRERSLHNEDSMRRKLYYNQSMRNDKDNKYYPKHKDILKYCNEQTEVLCYIISRESDLCDKYFGTFEDACVKYSILLDNYKNAINKATDDYIASTKESGNISDYNNSLSEETDNFFLREVDQILQETQSDIEKVYDSYFKTMRTDYSILEMYLTEEEKDGIFAKFKKALISIWEKVKNFFKSIFNIFTGKCKDEDDKLKSEFTNDQIDTFKKNCNKYNMSEENPNPNYLSDLEKKLDSIWDMYKKDMEEPEKIFPSSNFDTKFFKSKSEDPDKYAKTWGKYLMTDLDNDQVEKIKNKAHEMSEDLKGKISERIKDININSIFFKSSSQIDSAIIDVFNGKKKTEDDAKKVEKLLDRSASRFEDHAKSAEYSMKSMRFGCSNGSDPDKYKDKLQTMTDAYNGISLTVAKSYASAITNITKEIVSAYTSKYIPACRKTVKFVLNEGKSAEDKK